MIRSLKTTVALGAVLVLAACTGGRDSSSSQAAQISSYREALREVRAAKQPLPELTPALIESLPTAALEVVLEARGDTVFVVPYSDRTDRRKGALRTWRTASNGQIVMRDGVLIATRGLGYDLGSSRVLSVLNAVEQRSPVSGPHNYFAKGFDNSVTRIDLECEMQSLGDVRIDIVSSIHSVVHLRENCLGPDDLSVTNDYWVDQRDSTIWKSRQWGGPELGYLSTRLLKK
ncbi:YjbF family lipoprotein [uncultured Tateyamaria sp.]|nr:YjbF family lipoprotein [uncultured Tateyamaria sp.]